LFRRRFGQSEEGNPVAGFLLALYGAPDDAGAFDTYYEATHAPLAADIPGLRSFNISDGPVTGPDGAVVFHRAAVLTFDDLDAIKAGLAMPEGQATAADLAKFATGGVTLAMFEGKPITTE
jgi:uncharacterized protein (TIGR02118 family)